MPIYQRSDLYARMNAGIKNKAGMMISPDDTINDAVRAVLDEVDLRSTKRRVQMAPRLFSQIYQYAAPSDLKGVSVIGLFPQVKNGGKPPKFSLTTVEEFESKMSSDMVAVDDRDSVRKILVNAGIRDETLAISVLDSLSSGGGIWEATGDAENLSVDSYDYVTGSASLSWDIGSGGTASAGIRNASLAPFDFSQFRNSSLFLWQKISSVSGITGFTMKIGNDQSNNLSLQVTANSENTSFVPGWNLLRFDIASATENGVVDFSSFSYFSISMDKSTSKVDESGYGNDQIHAKNGEIYNLYYYSKYGWQSDSGTYKENSTLDSDYLNADTDEYNMIIQKAVELAASEVDEESIEKKANERFVGLASKYLMNNPSEAMLMQTSYYEF